MRATSQSVLAGSTPQLRLDDSATGISGRLDMHAPREDDGLKLMSPLMRSPLIGLIVVATVLGRIWWRDVQRNHLRIRWHDLPMPAALLALIVVLAVAVVAFRHRG